MKGPEEWTLSEKGFVEEPSGPVHKKHECPPDRLAMMRELDGLTQRYDERLRNQRQVIENLDTARKDALKQLGAWQEFGRALIAESDDAVAVHSARELLRQQGVEL